MQLTPEQIDSFKNRIPKWRAAKVNRYDKAFVAIYTKDRKQLREVLHLIECGEYAKAGEKAYWLDTVVRDQIPLKIYNEIIDKYHNQ